MLPAQTFSAIKTECSPPSSALRERKIDAICIFMRCLENSLIFGAKHSSPSAVMRGSVCFLFVLFSLTRKLNAQGNSFFCDKSPRLQLYKIIRVAAADESAFISFPPCAHSDLFFIFEINNIILRCIVCIPLALNFSLSTSADLLKMRR
jgi:hypothetical protein